MGEEDSIIINAAAEGSESCTDLKSIQESVNPLKIPFADADEDSNSDSKEDSNEDEDDEQDSDEDEDEYEDSDADEEDSGSDSVEEEVKPEEKRKSALQCLFMDADFIRVAKTLVNDLTILQLFRDVLKPLKKKDVTPDDVDEFYAAVSRVLTCEFFARTFYAESPTSKRLHFLINVRRFGILNKMRADAYGKTEKLMSVIKKDSFFDKISESEDDDMITRGVSGILIAFCFSESDLEGMARLYGIQEPQIWVDGPSTSDLIFSYSIKDDFYHIAGSNGVYYDREPYANIGDAHVTRFIALAPVGNKAKQVVPIPSSRASFVEQIFNLAAKKLGFTFATVKNDNNSGRKLLASQLDRNQSLFYVEVPGGTILSHVVEETENFPAQFGREVLAGLLNMADKADWRNCQLSKDEETEMADKFKSQFTEFDPNS